MQRQRLLAALGAAALVAVSAILTATPAPAPAVIPSTPVGPIVTGSTGEARPTNPHDLSTFDRQLQPSVVISVLTVETR